MKCKFELRCLPLNWSLWTIFLTICVLLNVISVVHSKPKPVILINKGQIHVRDSVQRFGHLHSTSRGSRFMNLFGINRRSANGLEPGISFSNNYWYPGDSGGQMDNSGFRPMSMSPSMSLINSPVVGRYQLNNHRQLDQQMPQQMQTTTMGYAPPAPATQTVRYFADGSATQPQAVYVGQNPNQHRQPSASAQISGVQSQGQSHSQHHQHPPLIRNKRLQNWMTGMNSRVNDAMKSVRKAWRTMMYRRTNTNKPNYQQPHYQQTNKQNSGTIAQPVSVSLPNQLTQNQASGSHKSERYRKGPPMPLSGPSAPIMTMGPPPVTLGQGSLKFRRNDYPGARALRWDPQPTMRKLRQAFTNLISG